MRLSVGIILSFFLSTVIVQSQNESLFDSVRKYNDFAKNQENDLSQRLKDALRAESFSKELRNDSLLLYTGRNLAQLYYFSDNIEDWESINRVNLILANKLSDTSALAVAHLNLALNKHVYKVEYDSAYYHYLKALKFFSSINKKESVAYIYMNLSAIQNSEKDYIGAETNAIEAIKIYQTLPQTELNLDDLWSLNNLLGAVSYNLERYKEALEYYEKAIAIANRMDDGAYNISISINNQASAYRELLDYDKALELYRSLIEMRSIYEPYDPTFYPLIINNIAYTMVLAGQTNDQEIQDLFYEAYKISDSLDDKITKLAVNIDLAKYYKVRVKTDSSLKYANKAYHLAKDISSNEILLQSMMLLSELNEGNSGKEFLLEHIQLTDSLLQVERNKINKFARIELETDQLEAENEQITKERLYLFVLSIALLLTAILVYVIITQRAKNKELSLVRDQQKANEEIYNLMLNQQDKVDEARAQEKIRVSKELHDGVLGRLFGTRLSLDSLNFVEGKEAIENRANYIGQLKTIEEDIRKISHELNTDFVSGSGFIDIVSELIETQTTAYGLGFDFKFTDDISWDLVSNKTKINIYRIIQESMQNIYKHAEAKLIKISITLINDTIALVINDDGKGFDSNRGKKGIGLKNMMSRASEINGNLEVDSVLGEGTTITVTIPYAI